MESTLPIAGGITGLCAVCLVWLYRKMKNKRINCLCKNTTNDECIFGIKIQPNNHRSHRHHTTPETKHEPRSRPNSPRPPTSPPPTAEAVSPPMVEGESPSSNSPS